MKSRSGGFRGKRRDGEGVVDWKRRRLAAAILSSSSSDSHALVKDETAIQSSATETTASPPLSLSSYFSCQDCFTDTEKKEPVITFCGHVFCWSCLYKSISLGINRLRGLCPTCKLAVDLCPRTKTVCPIYYVQGPQGLPAANFPAMPNSKNTSESESKGANKNEDENNREKTKERVIKIIKVDPSKRPSDKRPLLRSSFISSAIQDAATIAENFVCSFHCLLRDWKSAIDEFNDTIQNIQCCSKELYLRLVSEHEQGVRSVSSPMPSSFCSYFYCNYCHSDATIKQPIITYCGHVFCKHCFCDTILGSGLLECPVCRSAIDASTACPVSGNGEIYENQNRDIREKWQEAVLVLDPSAVQLGIYSQIDDLNHKIALCTKKICENILRAHHSMEEFRLGLQNHLVNPFIFSSRLVSAVDNFMKENANEVLSRMPNITRCSRPSEVIQKNMCFTATLPSSSRSCFSCGFCHKGTLNIPVVTYCTHLFCWHCLYFYIEKNGAFSEDGSLRGPCPVCNANNTVFSPTNANVTVIPICKAPNYVSQEHQNMEDEEGNIKTLPPCPTAKRISVWQLNKMRNILSQTTFKIKSLMNNLHLKMDHAEKLVYFNYEVVKSQRQCLLLGLLDGWCWAYSGVRRDGVIGTDKTDTQLSGLSKHWLDIVDVNSACTLIYESEVSLS